MKNCVLLLLLAFSLPAQERVNRRMKGDFGARPVTDPPAQELGTASVEGNVVNSVTHEPMRKVQVVLNGRSNATAVTDSAGHWAFRQLPAGSFQLQAMSPNFQSGPPRVAPNRITLAAGEQKAGVELPLTPPGSIEGTVLNEEGEPVANCNVMPMQWQNQQGQKMLTQRAGQNSDEQGNFHFDLAPGRYFVAARCWSNIPLPHPFIRRGPDAEIPMLSYAPQLYGGSSDVTGAQRITVAPGAAVTGINFRIARSTGVAVRGRVSTADTEPSNVQISVFLQPRDPVQRSWMQMGSAVVRGSGSFVIRNVAPGSYDLVATQMMDQQHASYASMPVNVGQTAPDPVELSLSRASALSGTVESESTEGIALENMRIVLAPVALRSFGQQPNGQVGKDGKFTLEGVRPGRWRLVLNGPNAFIKSVELGGQEVPPGILDIPPGPAPALRIKVSAKWAQADVAITGGVSEAGQVMALLTPAEPGLRNVGLERTFAVDPQGHFSVGQMAPGRYRVCAIANTGAWAILQNEEAFKAVEGRCETLELTEGAKASIQVPLISAADFDRITADLEQ